MDTKGNSSKNEFDLQDVNIVVDPVIPAGEEVVDAILSQDVGVMAETIIVVPENEDYKLVNPDIEITIVDQGIELIIIEEEIDFNEDIELVDYSEEEVDFELDMEIDIL